MNRTFLHSASTAGNSSGPGSPRKCASPLTVILLPQRNFRGQAFPCHPQPCYPMRQRSVLPWFSLRPASILSSVMTDSKSIVHCNRDLSYLNRMAVVTRKIPNSQRLCRRPPKDKQKKVFMRNHEIIKELTKANKSNRTVLISLKAKELHLANQVTLF